MKVLSNIKLFIFFTLILGIVYPISIFWIGNIAYPQKINGSLIKDKEKIIGSLLIGQDFTSEKFFQGRPSQAKYDALASGGSNLSPISSSLKQRIEQDRILGKKNEMLFMSASGLDPHISEESTLSQLDRIVNIRKLDLKSKERIVHFIEKMASEEEQSLFEIRKINVLKLNYFLEKEFN